MTQKSLRQLIKRRSYALSSAIQLSEQQLVKQWNEAMNSRLNGENIKQLADSARIHSQVLNNRLKQLL